MAFLLTGQTDSGKSTIAGHLLYKIGYFDTLPEEDKKMYRSALDKISTSTSKSKYSILMDIIDGEILTNKTKTQEFSICDFEYGIKFRLIDTPGHQLYIRSLLEGLFHVQNLSILCLVISSIENEFTESFEKGTVKEDLLLGRSIGCKHLIVLWNKIDVHKPTDEMKTILYHFCKNLRFLTTDNIYLSGYTGENIMDILDCVKKYTKEVKCDEVKEISTSKLCLKCFFFTDEVKSILLSVGFQFVLHHKTGEYDAEIERITDESKSITVIRDNKPVKIVLSLNRPITYSEGDKAIFRFQRYTIGCGVAQ